jgi:hypothetical protein
VESVQFRVEDKQQVGFVEEYCVIKHCNVDLYGVNKCAQGRFEEFVKENQTILEGLEEYIVFKVGEGFDEANFDLYTHVDMVLGEFFWFGIEF